MEKENIKDLIIYGINENNIDLNSIDDKRIDKVIKAYFVECNDFKSKYVQGELDTFKKASCLLMAIFENKLVNDKRKNAFIAIDASQKMCEKPYWNVGEKANIPYKMEEVDFKILFENDKYCYDTHRNMLVAALMYGVVTPISIHSNLELFYIVALELKKKKLKEDIDKIGNIPMYPKEIIFNDNDKQSTKNKPKVFSLLKK